MKKILLTTLTILVLLAMALCLVACNTDEGAKYQGMATATFVLEGGVYNNCVNPVHHYYDLAEGESSLIVPIPTTSVDSAAPGDTDSIDRFTDKYLARSEYRFTGWYRTRTEEADGTVVLTDLWDFEHDRMTTDGVTLYAGWKRISHNFYTVCYRDANDQVVKLGEYEVEPGERFTDKFAYAAKRKDKTVTPTGVFRTESGELWDMNTQHPGSEETSITIALFPDYIDGNFAIVRTATDLTKNLTRNIYLMNDIDMEGKSFGGFGTYSKELQGNGHKIFNFQLTYNRDFAPITATDELDFTEMVEIALFKALNKATVNDVHFDQVTVTVKDINGVKGNPEKRRIVLSPLAIRATESTVTNVTASINYTIDSLPDGYTEEDNLVILESPYLYQTGETESTFATVNCVLNLME